MSTRRLASAVSMVDWLFGSIGTRGKRALPTCIPTLFRAYFNGIGLLVTNKAGAVLATVGATPQAALVIAHQPALRNALRGREGFSLLPQPDGMLQLVTVPISIFLVQPEILGTVSVGFLLDNALAMQLKAITGSDVAFGMDGQILAATLPREMYGILGGRLRTSGISHLTVSGEDYLVLPRPLGAGHRAQGRVLAQPADDRHPGGPQRPQPFIFHFEPQNESFKFRIQFKRSHVSRNELIVTLREILAQLEGAEGSEADSTAA